MTERNRPTPEQDLAIRIEAPDVLVSASAGTGKTKTMVDRVLHVLRGGTPLDRLLVITFTQKAAEQLKRRLLQAFARDVELRAERLLLPQSYVTTIDAFCARLLREHSVDAGIDPGFRVLAPPEDELAIESILDDLFHHWYQGQPEDADWGGIAPRGSRAHHEFLRLIEQCGVREDRELLRRELTTLLRLCRVHPDPEGFIEHLRQGLDADPPPFWAPFSSVVRGAWFEGRDAYRQMLDRADRDFPDASFGKHRTALAHMDAAPPPWDAPREACPTLDEIVALRDHLEQTGLVESIAPWKLGWPRMPNRTTPLKPFNERAKKLLGPDGPLAWLPEVPLEITEQVRASRPTLETVLALLEQSHQRYQTYKKDRGFLDFSDLELLARRLLYHPPSGLLERFDMVMVDEFQDVNRLQNDIIRRLRPARGRFLVGDLKQCIYQFRLADPAVFRDLFRGARILVPGEEASGAQRARIYLSTNFRSRHPVLQAVNTIFSYLFTPRMLGGDYEAEALRHRGSPAADSKPPRLGDRPPDEGVDRPGWAPVEFHLVGGLSKTEPRASDRRLATEARVAARRIRQLREEGFQVPDGEKKWRPMRFSDVAIILRSPGPTGEPYARVLREEGIPVDFGGLDFFERPEVRDALNLMRILNNAHDDIALAAVLRSPAAEFSDDDLLRVHLAYPRSLSLLSAVRGTATGRTDAWSGQPGELPVPEVRDRCRRFIERFDAWRELVQAGDLATSMTEIMDGSGLLEATAAREGGTECLGHLEELLMMVRAYCREHHHGLPGLIHHLEGISAADLKRETLAEDPSSGDAVRILSLHKSKGLEFPIVIASLLGRGFNLRDASDHLLTGPDWIGVDLFDPQTYAKTRTVAHHTLSHFSRRQTVEEEIRILYVAMTRAEEKLILTGAIESKMETAIDRARLWQGPEPPSDELLLEAGSPLTWILGVMARCGWLDALKTPGKPIRCAPALIIQHHAVEEVAPAGETLPVPAPGAAALANLDLARLAERLERRYAHEEATRWRGKYWVTEIKRLIDQATAREEVEAGTSWREPPAFDAAEEGTWLHTVLESIDLTCAHTTEVLERARDLARAGRVPAEWVNEKSVAPIVEFLASELAAEMRARRGTLEREVSFSLKLSPERLGAVWPDARALGEGEYILVQGQIDALWRREDGSYRVLDFKSDAVRDDAAIASRVRSYRPQMLLYQEAVRSLWKADRVDGWLYFLRPSRAVQLS